MHVLPEDAQDTLTQEAMRATLIKYGRRSLSLIDVIVCVSFHMDQFG